MRKMSFAVIILAVIVFGLIGTAIWAAGQIWKSAPTGAPVLAFTIASSDGSRAIAEQLDAVGLIDSPWLFVAWVRLTSKSSSLQAGNDALPAGSGIAEIAEVIATGSMLTDVSVTIPEGFTLRQIGEEVEADLGISTQSWEAATGVTSMFERTMTLLVSKPDRVDLEGYLFPDTYRFAVGASAEDVVRTMLETMSARLAEANINFRDEGCEEECWWIENTHELLTLASIIEREVRTDDDRALVSGIFWNRLEIGMALQADSTINYVTGKKTPGVSSEDLQIDSPYNTYMYRGLPPGPIANPGLASIIAAGKPAATDYLYFLTTNDGEVIYAKTHDEHVADKAKYR